MDLRSTEFRLFHLSIQSGLDFLPISSHHLGLDCHDLCEYAPLKPGCIISNEPGLYIAEEGIGIRIEDDVLITEAGAEWLSPQIIKEVDEIEDFIKNNKGE